LCVCLCTALFVRVAAADAAKKTYVDLKAEPTQVRCTACPHEIEVPPTAFQWTCAVRQREEKHRGVAMRAESGRRQAQWLARFARPVFGVREAPAARRISLTLSPSSLFVRLCQAGHVNKRSDEMCTECKVAQPANLPDPTVTCPACQTVTVVPASKSAITQTDGRAITVLHGQLEERENVHVHWTHATVIDRVTVAGIDLTVFLSRFLSIFISSQRTQTRARDRCEDQGAGGGSVHNVH
jgi:hypothetical protein